jgi:hypothetical protein
MTSLAPTNICADLGGLFNFQKARRMRSSEEPLQPITMDDQVAPVADDEIIAFKLDEKFGYPRTRSAYQVSKVLVSCGYHQARSALVFDAEIPA